MQIYRGKLYSMSLQSLSKIYENMNVFIYPPNTHTPILTHKNLNKNRNHL